MQRLWAYDPATVRGLHTRLGPKMSYNTFLMICRRLVEKDLLERHRVSADDASTRAKQADVYTPRLSEAEFLRTAITTAPEPPDMPETAIPHQSIEGSERATIESLLVELGRLRDDTGQLVDAQLLAPLAGLLERAEAAEQAVLIEQAALWAAYCAAQARYEQYLLQAIQTPPATAGNVVLQLYRR